MAIVGGQDEEELNPSAPGAAGAAAGGEGGFVSGGSGGTGQTTKTGVAAPTSSGGYTNLSNYLQANQGSGGMTGRAAGNVVEQSGNAATQAREAYGRSALGDVNKATSDVGVKSSVLDSIAAGGATVDQSQLGKIKSGVATVNSGVMDSIAKGANATTGAYDGPTPDTSYKGPSKVTASAYAGPKAEDVHVDYKGPSDIGNFYGESAGLQAASQGANQDVYGKAKNAQGGQTGVSALLRSAYQQPSYTAGENTLDAFLAGGTKEGRDALGKADGIAKNAAGGYSKINDILANNIETGKRTAGVTNSKYYAGIGGASDQTAAVQKQYDDAIAAARGDTTARDAYGLAISGSTKLAADSKTAADKAAAEQRAAAYAQETKAKADAEKAVATEKAAAAEKKAVADQKVAAEKAAAKAASDKMNAGIERLKHTMSTPDATSYKKVTDALEMFPRTGRAANNPLIPDVVPNPVPVIPDAPKPEIIQLPNITDIPLPSLMRPDPDPRNALNKLRNLNVRW